MGDPFKQVVLFSFMLRNTTTASDTEAVVFNETLVKGVSQDMMSYWQSVHLKLNFSMPQRSPAMNNNDPDYRRFNPWSEIICHDFISQFPSSLFNEHFHVPLPKLKIESSYLTFWLLRDFPEIAADRTNTIINGLESATGVIRCLSMRSGGFVVIVLWYSGWF